MGDTYSWNGETASFDDPTQWTDESDPDNSGFAIPADDDNAIATAGTIELLAGLAENVAGLTLGDASLTLEGGGSSLTADTADIDAGDATVLGGAYLAAGLTDLDDQAALEIDGGLSTFVASGDGVEVGLNSQGSLLVSAGGTLLFSVDGTLDIGANSDASGDVTVAGDGSNITDDGPIFVGDAGDGSLTIGGAALVSATALVDIAASAGSTGAVVIDGETSLLSASAASAGSDAIVVGDAGSGTLTIQNGGTSSSTDTTAIGNQAGSNGTITVTGTDSLLYATATGAPAIAVGVAGDGTLAILSNGQAVATATVAIATDAGGTGLVLVDGAGSQLDAKDADFAIAVGGAGAGTLAVTHGGQVFAGGPVDVATAAGGSGAILVDGTGSLLDVNLVNAPVGVGDAGDGSLTVDDDGEFISDGAFAIGDHGSGTLTVSNSSTVTVATLVVNAGAVYADGGSAISVANDGFLGTDTANAGASVSGAATMTIGGTLTLGSGALAITGGGGVEIGGTAGVAGGTLQVDAGGLLIGHGALVSDVVATIAVGSAASIPDYSLAVDDEGTIEASGGSLVIEGGLSGSGDLLVDGGAILELAGALDAGMTVAFTGTGKHTLVLDDTGHFQGAITGIAVGDQIVLPDTSEANDNGIIAAAIVQQDGTQTLQILESGDTDPTHITHEIDIPVAGSTAHLSGDFFAVAPAANGTGAVLTLTAGNPIDLAVNGPAARQAFGVDGSGITIGIIADSFNALGGEASDIASGALPEAVTILQDGSGTDTGRAMAQIIHDIAPGATIVFDTAGSDAIGALQAAGAQIIVDASTLDASASSIIATAVADGVTYIAAAGDHGDDSVATPIAGSAADPNALTVAAMNALATPNPPSSVGGAIAPQTEPTSSSGTAAGKPDITGPDGGPTTFDAGPFFGTPAAAAAVSAVAALVLQEDPTLASQPLAVDQILAQSAVGFGAPSDEMGAGLVQAERAVALAADTPACFRTGTLILTDRGEILVEQLRIGDNVLTDSGVARPILWLGRRSYSARFIAGNPKVRPILIRQDALADGIPRRDLYVSPLHAMYLDGVLIPATALVNGVSIVPDDSVGDVAYVHVELATHDVILAEGAASETFVDDDSRGIFHNVGEFYALYPGTVRVPARYCAPRLEDGYRLEAMRGRLAARADRASGFAPGRLLGFIDAVGHDRVSGWAQDVAWPDRPVRLRISADELVIGEVVADRHRADLAGAGIGNGCHSFELVIPAGSSPTSGRCIRVQRVADDQDLENSPRLVAMPEPCVVRADRLNGRLDTVTRERLSGWAHDAADPTAPVELLVLDNGMPIARVLANQYRADIAQAGIGRGRHSFDLVIPDGLSPLARHVIHVRRLPDGADIPGSPAIIAPAGAFDPMLEQVVATAVASLRDDVTRAHALSFMARQVDRLLQQRADEAGGREGRIASRQHGRRTGVHEEASAGLRVLVVDEWMPVVGRDAGSQAIMSHMRALQRLGYAVSFVAASGVEPGRAAVAAMEEAGITCCGAPFHTSVEDVLRRQGDCFDVVYLHRVAIAARYLGLARHHARRARILYSVADLHHLRLRRQAVIEDRAELLIESRAVRRAEYHAAVSADVVITHSLVEAEMLRREVPGADVHHVPWDLPVRATAVEFSARHGVAFVGSYAHAPNCDAAQWLVEVVMPLVRQVDPTIMCRLVGGDMPDRIRGLMRPGVVVVGPVADLGASVFDQVRLTVAPMRYGAGVKGKVLESFAAGVPCVMSDVAAEGLGLTPGLRNLVAGEAMSLAKILCRMHSDESVCGAAAMEGQQLIKDRFCLSTVSAALTTAIGTAPTKVKKSFASFSKRSAS